MALGLPEDPAKQKKLLIGMLPLLLAFGYWYFLHPGYAQELQAMETRLATLETSNARARAASAQSRQLDERLKRFERHVDRLEQLVPRSEEVSDLLNQITQSAANVGVEVSIFRPGQTVPTQHYNRRTFELTVLGGYHNIIRFLTDIGSLPRIITPVDFEVTPRNELDRSGAQRLEASFDLVTYVLPDPGAATQGANAGA